MKKLFTQTINYTISGTVDSEFFTRLPEMIQKNADWGYSCQQRKAGCFLKPTFRNMPYRNSFVPEIDIITSYHDTHTMLHISGRPVKSVRVFMALWFSFLLLLEAFLIILTITSNLNSIFHIVIPIAMCVLGYLICELATKATFNSIVKAIQKECS